MRDRFCFRRHVPWIRGENVFCAGTVVPRTMVVGKRLLLIGFSLDLSFFTEWSSQGGRAQRRRGRGEKRCAYR